MEMARCMIKGKHLQHQFWMEAIACATHVLNRCPTKALKIVTPFEAYYGHKPKVDYMRVFGSLAYVHVPMQLRTKLDDKALKCIFVGYAHGSKGYRFFNPLTCKIIESRDAVFVEDAAYPLVDFDVQRPPIDGNVFEGLLPMGGDATRKGGQDMSQPQVPLTQQDICDVVHEEQQDK